MNTTIRVTLLLGAALCFARPAQAQYFGRNSVQYSTFKFKVLKTQHFDVYFYDKEADAEVLRLQHLELECRVLDRVASEVLSLRGRCEAECSAEQQCDANGGVHVLRLPP